MFDKIDWKIIVAVAIIFVILVGGFFLLNKKKIETYIDPIYLNKEKLYVDWYPRSNGTIYGQKSHVFSGFAYYNKAY